MRNLWKVIGILVSGLCWYLSFDLSGNYWYLLWIAPVPVLFISFRVSSKQSFVIACTAYLIGRLSWLPYLLAVLPIGLAILFTILLPLIFALIVLLTRKIVLVKQNSWGVFAFPVLWSLFEFILFNFSGDGTAGSIAYSESNFLPVVQIASVTGILGISFLVTLFPSLIAVTISGNYNKKYPLLIACLLIPVSLLFGVIRISNAETGQTNLTVGLAVVDEKFHAETNHPKPEDEMQVAGLYAEAVQKLARQGAQIIVLPEKIVNAKDSFNIPVKNILVNAAINNHVTVVAGYTDFVNDSTKHNNALVIEPEGNVVADYQKVNLFEGEAMNHFVPGKTIATFNLNNAPSGVAICKDMDYQDFLRKYALDKSEVLYVPAWDFIKDGWLHSRMAVLRGVENGYAVIRSARQGRLTVSDYRGRILAEASSENNKAASMVANINLTVHQTVYSRWGNWFAYLDIILVVYFLFILLTKRKNQNPSA